MKHSSKPTPILSTKLAPYTVFFTQSEEFHRLKQEIFSQHVYYFETAQPQPKILDIGAHIGLSTLYFKKLFPGAKITAVEPLPPNFRLLEENIWQNRLEGVNTIEAAVWSTPGELTFYYDESPYQWFSTASTLPQAWNEQQQTASTTVSAITLSSLLSEPIDFLKLDIEGAEQGILEEAHDRLHFVKEMIVEFHPVPHQSLPKLISLLEDNRFQVVIWKDGQEIQAKRAKGLVYVHAKQRI
jgi:FkbM family methyltransferase